MVTLASQPNTSRVTTPIARILETTTRQWNLSGTVPVLIGHWVVRIPPEPHHALVLDLTWGWCY